MTATQSAHAPCQPKLHTLVAILAIAGLADSIYLLVKHLTGEDVTCIASSGCSEVLSSPYSTLGPIPLGAIGALGYFLAFSLALLTAFGNLRAGTFLRILVAGMFATTLWLLYVQAFILHAFCDFCLLSAALTVSLSAIVTAGYFIEKRHRAAGEQTLARQA